MNYRNSSGIDTITWSESVDVALCYGWIDSKKIKIDDEKTHQFFCKRKAKSTWSKINKDKVEKLIEQGLMRQAGMHSIEIAKKNGSWNILDEVEALIIPDDLKEAFNNSPDAKDFFDNISKSSKKSILHWLLMAKRPETRLQRLKEIVENAAQKKKPKHIL
jgi:uncharacterized protein YdeI (YjbR/CyaY-like superfamily)